MSDAEVQTIDNPDLGKNVVQISLRLGPDKIDAAQKAMRRPVRLSPTSPARSRSARPSARASRNSALIAIIASLTVISIYIALRFEWKFAVPVLIALMHDILITGGVYALTGREVTTSTVAALLTILGFSLYDTIIVFDRVRENIPRMPSAAFSQIVNRSMSEVVVRSLATSFCTLLPVLALYFFGGDTLKDFAFALHRRHAVRHLLVDLHRRPGAHALEGARAGLHGARAAHQRAARRTCPRTRSPTRARPVDVAPAASAGAAGVTRRRIRRRASRGRSSTTWSPTSASRRSRREPAAAAARSNRPAGGRRARARGETPPTPPRAAPAAARSRQRRRGARQAQEAAQPQAREAALMGLLVWVMIAIALWHFTIFLPDHCWAGIVGAFLGAVVGSVIFGLIINGFTSRGRTTRTC